MSLLTAPFRFAERRVDDLARTVLPKTVRRHLPCRRDRADQGRPHPPAPDARARADRARHEAETYLTHRRARLRRELEARR